MKSTGTGTGKASKGTLAAGTFVIGLFLTIVGFIADEGAVQVIGIIMMILPIGLYLGSGYGDGTPRGGKRYKGGL